MRYLIPLLLLLAAACGVPQKSVQESAHSAAKKAAEPTAIADGRSLIVAMHARYADVWYHRLRVKQEVVFHDEAGEPDRREVWTELIDLPGKVRSVVGDETDNNGELYLNGAFHVIRAGKVTQTSEQPHPVLHLGYDVYCQPPEATASALDDAGFDLSQLHEATRDGKRIYIVGAAAGDVTTNQFWIDADRLLCERIIARTPRGALIDIRFTEYEPFAGAWLCTELIFRRDGKIIISERDLEHSIPESIDPSVFAIDREPASSQ